MSNRQRDRGLMWPPGSYHAVLADGRHVRISLCRTAKVPDRLPFDRAERFFRECEIGPVVAGYYHDKTTETWTADPTFDAAVCAGRWPASVEHYHEQNAMTPGRGPSEMLINQAKTYRTEHRNRLTDAAYNRDGPQWITSMAEAAQARRNLTKVLADIRAQFQPPTRTVFAEATYIASVPATAPSRRKTVAKAELVAFLRRAERGETTAADATALLAKLAA